MGYQKQCRGKNDLSNKCVSSGGEWKMVNEWSKNTNARVCVPLAVLI